MNQFRNILYVSHGIQDETNGLKQALSLARNNSAVLRVLVVYPEFPKSHQEYLGVYENALMQRMKQALETTQKAMDLPLQAVPVEVLGGHARASGIVRDVVRHRHDLVIKQAEPRATGKGLQAIDVELLRQCPVPVWLSRPIARSRDEMRVAVAVDAQLDTPGERQLALDLLRMGRAVADTCSGVLQVISCWDYEFENFLRGSIWSKVPEDEVARIVREVEAGSRTSLDGLLQEAAIGGKVELAHPRGNPVDMIPRQVQSLQIDILVIGTLGRTGIAGYVIGNTAENVIQAVDCSLLALKPGGFVSPAA